MTLWQNLFMVQTILFAGWHGGERRVFYRWMKLLAIISYISPGLNCVAGVAAADVKPEESPADHLPAHSTRLTGFGERADWSPDGRRLLFLSKAFGDALELDLETK